MGSYTVSMQYILISARTCELGSAGQQDSDCQTAADCAVDDGLMALFCLFVEMLPSMLPIMLPDALKEPAPLQKESRKLRNFTRCAFASLRRRWVNSIEGENQSPILTKY
jgi:hypothetical protein